MYTPIYEKESSRYIIINSDYNSLYQEEAIMKGVIGQLILIDLDYNFTGECMFIDVNTQIYSVKETLPSSGKEIQLGLVSGKLFNQLNKGNKTDEVLVPDLLFKDPIFIIEIIAMNDESNVTVGIGYDRDDYTPYVLILGITQDEAMTPEKAREIGSHLLYASEASEMDSFIRRALDSAYEDDEMSNEKKNLLLDAIRNLREQERNEKIVAKEQEVESSEQLETIESGTQTFDSDVED